MSAQALVLSGAGKAFRTYRSEWQRTLSWFGVPAKPLAEHWVLRNVSFSVAPGETLGIVGRNGAGKSTLLKLIAGTLRASEGSITTNGRSAALLELGMGFNPEFSGRQNASYAAGLMGFDHESIQGALPAIEAFADIGDYFDQPIRTYSSGMQMRVAFAVATAFRPDLLMVDEALSVGDVAFQRKSFRRIEQYVEMGTALLYVSHSTETVKRLSERALWIADGAIVMDASCKQVCEAYEKHMLGNPPPFGAPPLKQPVAHVDASLTSNIEVQYGDGRAEITDVTIRGVDGSPANVIGAGEPFSVTYRVRFFDECTDVHFGMMIKTVEGVCVYATNTGLTHSRNVHHKHDVVQIAFELNNNLIPGMYYLNCGTTCADASGRPFLHRRLDVAILRIMATDASVEAGLSNLQAKASVDLLVG